MELRVLVLDDRIASVYPILEDALALFLSENGRKGGGMGPELSSKIRGEETIALERLGADLAFQFNSHSDYTAVRRAVESGEFDDPVDLVLLDDNWGGGDEKYAGQEKLLKPVFETIRTKYDEPPVITLWTRHWDEHDHTGRFAELLREKPFWESDGLSKITGFAKGDIASLRVQIQRIVGERRLSEERDEIRQELKREKAKHHIPFQLSIDKCPKRPPSGIELKGTSEPMRYIYGGLEKLAQTDMRIHVYGERGTGKELFAKAVHEMSKRRHGDCISVDCGAIPQDLFESELFGHKKGSFSGATKEKRGRVEMADGGTLFLDEVGNMPLGMQIKMLGFLGSGEFWRVGGEKVSTADVRVVSATNQDLWALVGEGKFKDDLFDRLRVGFRFTMPPLRQKPEDIPEIVQHILRKNKMDMTFSDDAYAELQEHNWPGNVRELKGVVELVCAVVDGGSVSREDIRSILDHRPQREVGQIEERSTDASDSRDKEEQKNESSSQVNNLPIPSSLQSDKRKATRAKGWLDEYEDKAQQLRKERKEVNITNIAKLTMNKQTGKPINPQTIYLKFTTEYKKEFKAWGEAFPAKWPLLRTTDSWQGLQK